MNWKLVSESWVTSMAQTYNSYQELMLEGLDSPDILKAFKHLLTVHYTPHREQDLEVWKYMYDKRTSLCKKYDLHDPGFVSFSEVVMYYSEKIQDHISAVDYESAAHLIMYNLNVPSYNETIIIDQASWGEIRDSHNMFGLDHQKYSEVKGLGFDSEFLIYLGVRTAKAQNKYSIRRGI